MSPETQAGLSSVFANYSVELEKILSHTVAASKVLHVALWSLYRNAGAPHGDSQGGFLQWLDDNACEDARYVVRREAELLGVVMALRERRVA